MNGLVIVNKSAGMTSHDVVARLRRVTGENSIGHLGTLDPMATGVLPLLLGRYTRLAQFFRQDAKSYTGKIRFGFATDTYDAEGSPLTFLVKPKICRDALQEWAAGLTGNIEQMPPPYSAKKVDGVPAYRHARAGKPVELRPVQITVHRFEILDCGEEEASFLIEISSGGYIRSLAHELGKLAGCGAHLTALCRIQAGEFALDQAIALDQIAAWMEEGELEQHLPHPRELLSHMPAVSVDEGTAIRLRNGMACGLPEYSSAPLVRIFTSQSELFAIGRRLAGALIQPTVVLG